MHISDDYSFDITPNAHLYIVCTGESTNGAFTLVSNALVEMSYEN